MEKRGFKGVWIPKEIWLDQDLSIMEKLFLVEIDSLDNEKGCFASNKHFSEFFGLSKGRCTQIIKELEKKKMIKISYEREGKQITKRVIRVVNKLSTPVNKLNKGSKKTKQGYLENDEESNTSNNNTSTTADVGEKIPYKQIIEYLNKKTNKKISYQAEGNKKLIRARWSEGYTLEDFKKVIDNKVDEWYGTNVIFSNGKPAENYLHPSTLFRQSHFDKYLNQVPVTKAEKQGANHNYTVDLDELLGGG